MKSVYVRGTGKNVTIEEVGFKQYDYCSNTLKRKVTWLITHPRYIFLQYFDEQNLSSILSEL